MQCLLSFHLFWKRGRPAAVAARTKRPDPRRPLRSAVRDRAQRRPRHACPARARVLEHAGRSPVESQRVFNGSVAAARASRGRCPTAVAGPLPGPPKWCPAGTRRLRLPTGSRGSSRLVGAERGNASVLAGYPTTTIFVTLSTWQISSQSATRALSVLRRTTRDRPPRPVSATGFRDRSQPSSLSTDALPPRPTPWPAYFFSPSLTTRASGTTPSSTGAGELSR